MAHLIFLSLLVSLDGFFSGFTFRLKKIRICLPQLLFISLCPLVIVTAVMLSSQRMTAGIPAGAAKGLGFVLFFCLAYLSFADALKKRKSSPPTLITMINNPASSDLDHNQRLSSREALLLGLALSLDNAVLGFSFALDGAPVISTALCFAIVNFLLVMAGNLCPGLPFIDRFEKGSEYLPSLLFLILAFSRLL